MTDSPDYRQGYLDGLAAARAAIENLSNQHVPITPGVDDYITSDEFADMARTSRETVRYWKHVGKGPKSFKLGRRVLYVRQDVLDWIESERDVR